LRKIDLGYFVFFGVCYLKQVCENYCQESILQEMCVWIKILKKKAYWTSVMKVM